MRFAVLAAPDSWYLRDLQRAAEGRHEVTPICFSEIAASLGDSSACFSGEHDLCAFAAVLVRTMPPGSLEQVVFRMDVLGRLEAAGCTVINPPRAIEAAVDKYLASAKLAAAGLATPPTLVCQTVDDALAGFDRLGGDVVIKPLFGSEGRGITRVSDKDLALRAFKMLQQLGAVIYLQQFIEHEGYDIRVLVIGDRLFAMRRRNPHDWRTNVSRGATTEPLEISAELAALARRATDAIGAVIAGVDLLFGRDGKCYVLEVNAVPGWKALARTCQTDIAQAVLDLAARSTSHHVDD